jgi:GNAT superfamily N-acetyltransferase
MTAGTDADLYLRGTETLLASWEEYARGASSAAVQRSAGVDIAVFPNGPERAVYNNALLERDLTASERATAVDSMEGAYAAAGVTRFAAWVHESDGAMRHELERRGYTLDTSTRAMGMVLDDLRVPEAGPEVEPTDWSEYLHFLARFGAPSGLLSGADPTSFHIVVARLAGEAVAAAIALDFDGDCGIYNIGTLEQARRRGLGTAVTALHLHQARARGCRTATLQSTEMAERLYSGLGFRDLGRILEYAP